MENIKEFYVEKKVGKKKNDAILKQTTKVYDGKLHPGEIFKVVGGEKAIEGFGDKFYKWPARHDLCLYRSENYSRKNR